MEKKMSNTDSTDLYIKKKSEQCGCFSEQEIKYMIKNEIAKIPSNKDIWVKIGLFIAGSIIPMFIWMANMQTDMVVMKNTTVNKEDLQAVVRQSVIDGLNNSMNVINYRLDRLEGKP
jgi:hypothetical protein